MTKRIHITKSKMVKFLVIAAITLLYALAYNSFGNECVNIDSSVFQYIAKEVMNGSRLYVDTFDHKGPLLYVLNIAGLFISEKYGIWLIEYLFLFVAFIFSYKSARLFADEKVSILAFFGLYPWFYYVQGGNLCETYSLPFIAVSVYLFLLFFRNGNLKSYQILCAGFCFGCVLLLKGNMIGVWLAGCIMALTLFLKNKQYKQIFRYMEYFFLGCLIIVVPFVFWFSYQGILKDAFECYILFNFGFFENSPLKGDSLLDYTQVAIAVLSCLFLWKNRTKEGIFLGLSIFTTVAIILSAKSFAIHYLTILLPSIMILLAYSFTFLNDKVHQKAKKAIISLLLFLPFIPYYYVLFCSSLSNKIFPNSPHEIFTKIQDIVEKDETITVYGNYDLVYLKTDRMSASRYSYQYPIAQIDDRIQEEYFMDLEKNMPKVIIWDKCITDEMDDKMYEFIENHGYVQNQEMPFLLVKPEGNS